MNLTIRKALPEDKEFIIDAIIAAEKGASDLISYCYIFSITEEEFRVVLSNMIDEDIEGQELSISTYLIAEVDGERAGAMSGWVEMENGMSSNMIKTNLLMHFLDRDVILRAAPHLQLMSEIEIHRTPYTLQIESTYTVEKFRGFGVYGKLVTEHIKLNKERAAKFEKVQVIIMKDNVIPCKALMKLGFVNMLEKRCKNEQIFKIFSSDTKILMERALNII